MKEHKHQIKDRFRTTFTDLRSGWSGKVGGGGGGGRRFITLKSSKHLSIGRSILFNLFSYHSGNEWSYGLDLQKKTLWLREV